MRISKLATWFVAGAICLMGASIIGYGYACAENSVKSVETVSSEASELTNDTCFGCHENEDFSIPGPDGKPRQLYVNKDKFQKSVHGKRACVECHTDITEIPHKEGVTHKVSCVTCHEALWEAAKANNKIKENERLGVVVQQINRYMKSIHARPSKEDQSRTNATCYNCHVAHYIYPEDTQEREEWRLGVPNACGKCHVKEREQYATSVHGKAVLNDKNPGAAICSDCHTTHDVEDPAKDTTKLVITKNCGGCHTDSFKTYTETYHGQVNLLGYAHTAKCFDCHGSHTIQRVDDPKSLVHPANRLKTCQKCHSGATKGFVTFEPHATPQDPHRYPEVWFAYNFMFWLLAGTFAFFWTHTVLWFYREYKERKEHKSRLHVRTDELLEGKFKGKRYQRFPLLWRIVHLIFALSLMILTLTGMTLFYSDTNWAPVVMRWFGGPKVAGLVHRISAVIFAAMFFVHLIYILPRIFRKWKTLGDWFGPNSLIPNLQDFKDIYAMFKWFIGKGQRPIFDRWTYWEKFDYWAPFWGVTIIGVSGAMLWLRNVTAAFLPGWVFNVAMIFHGEEALLAALFLFTVHFFNNHFRPDKFPLDLVMFTGTMRLEDFVREHRVEYDRLVASGELEKYMVDEPSRPMTLGSKILGFTLLAFGLLLLVFVLIGVFGKVTGG